MYNNSNYNYKLVNDDIEKMHLLPPHCPMTPSTYANYFSNKTKLEGVAPYVLETKKHPKYNKQYYQIKYRNFYDNDNSSRKAAESYTSQKMYPMTDEVKLPSPNTFVNESTKMYLETKRKEPFPTPLSSNGTNQLQILFNNKCERSTFDYKRFGDDNKYWIDNPIYYSDVSKDTKELSEQYGKIMDDRNVNLYSSVFEDMYILGYDASEKQL
jgi:hypothetical protein